MRTGRAMLAVVILPLLLAACGPKDAERQSVKLDCEPPSADIEQALVLMAQAVPTSGFVPCLRTLPAGWALSSFDARSGQAEIWFDSDRAGPNTLHVIFAHTCAVRGTGAPLDETFADDLTIEIRKLATRLIGTRYYRFQGGCLLERFDYPIVGNTVLLADTTAMIDLTPRGSVEDQLAKHGLHL